MVPNTSVVALIKSRIRLRTAKKRSKKSATANNLLGNGKQMKKTLTIEIKRTKSSMQGSKKNASALVGPKGGKGNSSKDQKKQSKDNSSSNKPAKAPKIPDVIVSKFEVSESSSIITTKDGKVINNREELIDLLRSDCVRAFTAKGLSEREDKYSTGSTFFITADATPKNGLESLAQQIFRKHAEGKYYDASRSGAEWWTQVIDPEDDIGFHWDRDYDLEEEEGIYMYPTFGTVSYLSDIGAPTLVIDAVGTATADEDIQGEFSRVTLCYPQTFRHLRFDGRLLHAAPADLLKEDEEEDDDVDMDEDEDSESEKKPTLSKAKKSSSNSDDKEEDDVDSSSASDNDENESDFEEESISSSVIAAQHAEHVAQLMPKRSEKRITFLVNIWLDHAPSQGAPLPLFIDQSLQSPVLNSQQLSLLSAQEANIPTHKISVADSERIKMASFMHTEFVFDVAVPLPEDISELEKAAEAQEVVTLQYTGEVKPMVMLNEIQAMMAAMNQESDEDDGEDDEDDVQSEDEDEEEEDEKPLPPFKKQRRG